MPIVLPPKVYQTLAPAIKGIPGVACEVKFTKFMKVFTGYFGCVVEERKDRLFKVSPPLVGRGLWVWARTSFFIRKPANQYLVRQDLYVLRKTLKDNYDWDHKTIVRSFGGRGQV